MINENEFVELWNGKSKAKDIKLKFKISSDSQLYKLVREFGLYKKRDYRHPYNKNLNKRIRRLYWRGYSIKSISNIIKISSDNVHKRLINMNIDRRSCHERNVLYNQNKQLKSKYSVYYIREFIKKNYNKMSINKMADELGCDFSTIKMRLEKMNLKYYSKEKEKVSPAPPSKRKRKIV